LAATLVLSLSIPARAHVTPLTERQIAAGSPHVVVAVVEDARSRWNESRSLIVTDFSLHVEDRLRGDAPERITLTVPGGTVDGETHGTCVSTPLAVGARYLLFLQDLDRPSLVPITGGWQGAFREQPEEKSFDRLVRSARRLLAAVETDPQPGDTSWLHKAVQPDLPAKVYDPAAATFPAMEPAQPEEAKFSVRSPAVAPLVFDPLPRGTSFFSVDQQMMASWNRYVPGLFRVSSRPSPGWAFGNGVSEMAGFPTDLALGFTWSDGIDSVVFTRSLNNRIVEADIALNPASPWTLDDALAARSVLGGEEHVSFRAVVLACLGTAWGYEGAHAFGSLEPVSRDSVKNFKPAVYTLPILYAEDTRAARATYRGKPIRDGLISPYRLLPLPLRPAVQALGAARSTVQAGESFDFVNAVTLENPGTVKLTAPTLEVYLAPQRFSSSGAILLKRIKVEGILPSGEARTVELGSATVPGNTPAGTYVFLVVLNDPKDANQANNRAWTSDFLKFTVTR
jgi:hypothetical protein